MIAQAIQAVVDKTSVLQSAPPKIVSKKGRGLKTVKTKDADYGGTVHEANMDAEDIDKQLRQRVVQNYGKVEDCFADICKGDSMTRKEFKAGLSKLGMRLSDGG